MSTSTKNINENESLRIIAIDPGFERMGVAILEKTPRQGGKETLLFSTCLRTNPKDDFFVRIKQLGLALEKIIKEFAPERMAIETLFFSNNQKTAMRVSEVRGAIILLAIQNNLEIFEFNPTQIKSTITGSGNSTKDQIIKMIRLILKTDKIALDDEYDAIACGLTCLALTKY